MAQHWRRSTMMFILSIMVLFCSLLLSTNCAVSASASPHKSLDGVNPAITILEAATKPQNERKSAMSQHTGIIPRISKDAKGRDDASKVTPMIGPDDDKSPKQDTGNASEWELHQNETSKEGELYYLSTKSNFTVVLPFEPDTAQSSTLIFFCICSFLALSICAALQHWSSQGDSRRHEYQEVGNIVV